MSKRGRTSANEQDEVRYAIELLSARPLKGGEEVGLSLTPLEKQVVALKRALRPHTLLMVACGYRVKLYGRDSRVVSRRTGIMCIPGQPFEYSSVPYTRVDLYVHRLVAMGYHVAFADQESAAVRAADGVRGGIFSRSVSQLCSRGTLLPSEHVGVAETTGDKDDGQREDGEAAVAEEGLGDADVFRSSNDVEPSELFMCFVRPTPNRAAAIEVVLVSFVTRRRDYFVLSSALGLEDVLHRYDIVELIIIASREAAAATTYLRALPESFALVLQNTLQLHFGPTVNGEEDNKNVSVSGYTPRSDASVDQAIAEYLVPYKLDQVYAQLAREAATASGGDSGTVKQEGSDRDRPHAREATQLTLPGSTLRALEVFYSSSGPTGSLLHLLDHCSTICGARLLRAWLAAPLADVHEIQARQDAVTALLRGEDAGMVEQILQESSKVGDVEAVLGKLHAQRCGVLEYIRVLRMVRGVALLGQSLLDTSAALLPPYMCSAIASLTSPEVAAFLRQRSAELTSTAVTPLELFTERGMAVPEELQAHMRARDSALAALDAELERAREVLRLPGLQYRTVAGTPFVLDVASTKCERVPSDWTVLTRTKTNVRYHTPTIIEQNVALCAARERLGAAATSAWHQKQQDLTESGTDMAVVRAVIAAVAVLDAVRSLSITSARAGYVAPELREHARDSDCAVDIDGGRHPVLDVLLHGQYVSCEARLRVGGAWLLTGPNMGGKSAFMRMVGTFVILAQLGCYVPAVAARLPVFSGLYCRMGSSDAILEGSSTFLTEMVETSCILGAADLSSALVLMDELGRGTSSFDGAAVAGATLQYLLQRGATTIFVTHYAYLCDPYRASAAAATPSADARVECFFMGFREEVEAPCGEQPATVEKRTRLVFTYKPCRGVTPSSFGVEVAKLAGLPDSVTDVAKLLSLREEEAHAERQVRAVVTKFMSHSC